MTIWCIFLVYFIHTTLVGGSKCELFTYFWLVGCGIWAQSLVEDASVVEGCPKIFVMDEQGYVYTLEDEVKEERYPGNMIRRQKSELISDFWYGSIISYEKWLLSFNI